MVLCPPRLVEIHSAKIINTSIENDIYVTLITWDSQF